MQRPDDTMVAVEMANTRLDDARSGIPEVWIVNLAAEEVEVHRSPAAESYSSVTHAGRSDALAIEAIPGVLISVAEIFA